ncbi:MAG: L-threonylcarbamoyladenylate synthase, partial [Veillonella sp.]|nr:L-threonylcarbamoyladenylate synthase [Veillonella sp.]
MTQGEEKLGTQLEENRDSQLGQSTGPQDLETQVVKNPKAEEIQHMGALLREGKLVAIPTETVYGLGANGLDPEAMAKIYQAKGRPSDNPLILHVASQDQVPLLVKEVTPTAKKLMDTFWPGPLT